MGRIPGGLGKLIYAGLLAMLLISGCAETNNADSPAPANNGREAREIKALSADKAAFFYLCERDFRFRTLIRDERAMVFLPDTTLRLTGTASSSGAKFSDGAATYWKEGDEARLEFDDESFSACRAQSPVAIWQSRARGAFRALGQEPGWVLTVTPGEHIGYQANYGENEYAFPTPPSVVDTAAATTTYRVETDAHDLKVVFKGERCFDIMSGWPFPMSVRVTFDGQTYRGCGRPVN